MSNLGLAGPLSGSLANLTSLSSINFTGNSLTGGIPAEWSADNALPALATLLLASNNLGTLPSALGGGGMKALQTVALQSNELTGVWATRTVPPPPTPSSRPLALPLLLTPPAPPLLQAPSPSGPPRPA